MSQVRQTIGYRLLHAYVRWVVTACYCRRFEVRGRQLVPEDRPVLFVTTHQNNLLDALATLFASARRPVFVARADFFRPPLVARFFRFLRMLPMYRADHGRQALETKLPETMRQLEEHLAAGGACAIMAEGSSTPERRLRRLKKGWARLTLDVLPEAPTLAVVPVAIDYSGWDDWGADIRVTFGEPLSFEPVEEAEAPRQLNRMNEQLHDELASLVADDEAVDMWHRQITETRRPLTWLWRIAGMPVLVVAMVALAPILLLTRQRVRAHPRADFKSTIEVALMTLGTPLWCLVLGVVAWALFGFGAFLVGALLLPVLLWVAARSFIAWTVS